MVADKLSRLGQTIQTEWSLLPDVFQAICNRWHQPQIDLFATRFNNKLPECVAPVVIPALAPTLDRSLKPDRSLCPVRALRYYLDRTSDIRQNKELIFVSFKKGFDKDISPATISSWIKQTVILCCELSDQEAHTLHQVKAHDVRAFAASKAFQSGISLEQILSACLWKSHNTFTQFYLKDVAWADSELYHLGPVVAAQQIHK